MYGVITVVVVVFLQLLLLSIFVAAAKFCLFPVFFSKIDNKPYLEVIPWLKVAITVQAPLIYDQRALVPEGLHPVKVCGADIGGGPVQVERPGHVQVPEQLQIAEDCAGEIGQQEALRRVGKLHEQPGHVGHDFLDAGASVD